MDRIGLHLNYRDTTNPSIRIRSLSYADCTCSCSRLRCLCTRRPRDMNCFPQHTHWSLRKENILIGTGSLRGVDWKTRSGWYTANSFFVDLAGRNNSCFGNVIMQRRLRFSRLKNWHLVDNANSKVYYYYCCTFIIIIDIIVNEFYFLGLFWMILVDTENFKNYV